MYFILTNRRKSYPNPRRPKKTPVNSAFRNGMRGKIPSPLTLAVPVASGKHRETAKGSGDENGNPIPLVRQMPLFGALCVFCTPHLKKFI